MIIAIEIALSIKKKLNDIKLRDSVSAKLSYLSLRSLGGGIGAVTDIFVLPSNSISWNSITNITVVSCSDIGLSKFGVILGLYFTMYD